MTVARWGRVLVTGGAGFIGSHLVDALFREGAERVVVVDNFFLDTYRNLDDAHGEYGDALVVYREDAGDLGAMTAICRKEKPDVVFNLATKALLYSFLNPSGAYRVNTDIALTLCELLRAGEYLRLIHVSSSEVYGSAQEFPMTEEHPLGAETTYAAGKAGADLAVVSYVKMFDLDAMIVRPFNNYGPRQNDGSFAAVIPLTMKRILAGEPPLVEGDGSQTRDFIFVSDTVDAITRLARTDVERGQVFNVASGREVAIVDLVGDIARIMGWTGDIVHAPARPADVRRHRAAVERVTGVIGDVAPTSLAVGLEHTIKWYVERSAV